MNIIHFCVVICCLTSFIPLTRAIHTHSDHGILSAVDVDDMSSHTLDTQHSTTTTTTTGYSDIAETILKLKEKEKRQKWISENIKFDAKQNAAMMKLPELSIEREMEKIDFKSILSKNADAFKKYEEALIKEAQEDEKAKQKKQLLMELRTRRLRTSSERTVIASETDTDTHTDTGVGAYRVLSIRLNNQPAVPWTGANTKLPLDAAGGANYPVLITLSKGLLDAGTVANGVVTIQWPGAGAPVAVTFPINSLTSNAVNNVAIAAAPANTILTITAGGVAHTYEVFIYKPLTVGLELETEFTMACCHTAPLVGNCLGLQQVDKVFVSEDLTPAPTFTTIGGVATTLPFFKGELEVGNGGDLTGSLELITGAIEIGGPFHNQVSPHAADSQRALALFLETMNAQLTVGSALCPIGTTFVPFDVVIAAYNAAVPGAGFNTATNWYLTPSARSPKVVANVHLPVYQWWTRCGRSYTGTGNTVGNGNMQVNFAYPLSAMSRMREGSRLYGVVANNNNPTHWIDLFSADGGSLAVPAFQLTLRAQYLADRIFTDANAIMGHPLRNILNGLTDIEIGEIKGTLTLFFYTLAMEAIRECQIAICWDQDHGHGKNHYWNMPKAPVNDLTRFWPAAVSVAFRTWYTGAHLPPGSNNVAGIRTWIINQLNMPDPATIVDKGRAGRIDSWVTDQCRRQPYLLNGVTPVAGDEIDYHCNGCGVNAARTAYVVTANVVNTCYTLRAAAPIVTAGRNAWIIDMPTVLTNKGHGTFTSRVGWATRYGVTETNAAIGTAGVPNRGVFPAGVQWFAFAGVVSDRTFAAYRSILDGRVAVVVESRIRDMPLNIASLPTTDHTNPKNYATLANMLRQVAQGHTNY